MYAYPESTEIMNMRSVLLGHNGFQEDKEQFVAEFESGLNRVSGREYEGWGDDCAGVYWRDGNDLKSDVTSDSGEWEWY